MKKIIFHIIPKLTNGGAETVLTRLVEEFTNNNIEQTVITLTGSTSDFHYDSIKKHCRVLDWKRNSTSIEALMVENPNSTILAWMYPSIFFAHKLKKRLRTKHPIIWNIRHSSFRWNQLYQKLALFGFGLYSHIVAPKIMYCSYRSQEVHEKYFFSKKKSTVIQNRLAKKRIFSQLDDKKKDKKDEPFFLYVGRYDPIKGPRRLVQILNKFFPQNSGINLRIAGSGWTIDKIPLQIRDRVFLLGNVKNIFPLYREAHALLFTSHAEGYPNVLVEAIISGTPIIGFEAGDSKLILDNYKFGYSIKTSREFIDKLSFVLNNSIDEKEKADEIAHQQERLDFSITVQEYLHFLELDS